MSKASENPAVLSGDPYYDPYDYAIDANPHPTWKRLR